MEHVECLPEQTVDLLYSLQQPEFKLKSTEAGTVKITFPKRRASEHDMCRMPELHLNFRSGEVQQGVPGAPAPIVDDSGSADLGRTHRS